MKTFAFLVLSSSGLLLGCASSAYDVIPADRKFISATIAAVGRKDADWIAAHTALPVVVAADGRRQLVKTREEFATIVSRALTPDLIARFRSEEKKAFKNWQGVMIGDGLLWVQLFYLIDDFPPEYRILAFGGFAFQPDEPNKAPEPTTGTVTPRAEPRVAPVPVVAHL